MRFLIRILVTAVALWVAVIIVDGISVNGSSTIGNVLTLLAVAVIFGFVNAIIKPIVKIFGCFFYIITLGLIALFVNALLFLLGVDTQGENIMKLFAELDSPVWFFIVGAIFAPLVEEIFFRGFLFQGFRARYGWVTGMLLSAAVFAVAHLDLVVLIPTFILGCLLAYVFHRSNSIWPGVILHFLVNSFGLLGAYFASNYPNMFPT